MGSSPSGANLTKVKDLVYRAYMKFLMPIELDKNQVYIWSFCRKDAVLSTKKDEDSVILPDDFVSMVLSLKYDSDNQYTIREVPLNILRLHRTFQSNFTAYPYEYSIIQGPYSPAIGQRKLVEFYPTPDDNYSLHYTYAFIPDKPENDSDYFVGGVLASEVILEMALAEAETQEDETKGVHAAEAVDKFNRLLKQDMPNTPKMLPPVVDGATNVYNPFSWREWQIPTGTITVYGEEL